MSLTFTSGVVGAEARDELIHEGKVLYALIRDDHLALARDKALILDTGEGSIPWMVEESVCIALALYVRQQAKASA